LDSTRRVPLAIAVLAIIAAGGRARAAEIDAQTLAKANNPLADMNAFNFHDYYSPSLHGVPDETSNTMNLRGVAVAGRQIIRATLPVSTVPGTAGPVSGLGDLNVFDAIVLTPPDALTTIGVGPLLVLPTATEDALGAPSTWQVGGAVVAVRPLAAGSVVGALVTWQTDFAGGDRRVNTSLLTGQMFLTISVGGGWYVRSSPLAVFDLENDVTLVPFGLGMGKVVPLGRAVVNAFVEPQFTVYHEGRGVPSQQVFAGLNFQFAKK